MSFVEIKVLKTNILFCFEYIFLKIVIKKYRIKLPTVFGQNGNYK